MTTKTAKCIISLVLLIVANIGIFCIGSDFEADFWISYAYAMVASLITIYVLFFLEKEQKLIFSYPIAAVTLTYLVVAVVLAWVCATFLDEHMMFLFLSQLFVLAAYIVMVIVTLTHNNAVKVQQAERGKDILNFKYILEEANEIISKMDYSDPNRKKVMHMYDALASGQVKSSPNVIDVEQRIMSTLNSLEMAVDSKNQESIDDCCKLLEQAADERKRKLSMREMF